MEKKKRRKSLYIYIYIYIYIYVCEGVCADLFGMGGAYGNRKDVGRNHYQDSNIH